MAPFKKEDIVYWRIATFRFIYESNKMLTTLIWCLQMKKKLESSLHFATGSKTL